MLLGFVQKTLLSKAHTLPQMSELLSWLAIIETTCPNFLSVSSTTVFAPIQRFSRLALLYITLDLIEAVSPSPVYSPFFPTMCHVWQLQSFQITKASTTPLTLQSLYHIHWFLKAQPQQIASSAEMVTMVKTFQAGSHLRLSSSEKAMLKASQLESPVCWLMLALMQSMTVSITVLLTWPQPCQAICLVVIRKIRNRGVNPLFCFCIRNYYKPHKNTRALTKTGCGHNLQNTFLLNPSQLSSVFSSLAFVFLTKNASYFFMLKEYLKTVRHTAQVSCFSPYLVESERLSLENSFSRRQDMCLFAEQKKPSFSVDFLLLEITRNGLRCVIYNKRRQKVGENWSKMPLKCYGLQFLHSSFYFSLCFLFLCQKLAQSKGQSSISLILSKKNNEIVCKCRSHALCCSCSRNAIQLIKQTNQSQ